MLHEPAAKQDTDPASHYKMRLGKWLFLFYTCIYIGFVAINVVEPKAMEMTVLGGLNLAVVYGFGLIVFALILALIYNKLCKNKENAFSVQSQQDQTGGES